MNITYRKPKPTTLIGHLRWEMAVQGMIVLLSMVLGGMIVKVAYIAKWI